MRYRAAFLCVAVVLAGCRATRPDVGASSRPSPVPQAASASSAEVPQPVHEHFWSDAAQPGTVDGKPGETNPFRHYTHLGTDYGRMGPSGEAIAWRPHEVSVTRAAGWAGMWYSLAGLARESGATLDFGRLYPEWIGAAWQPQAVGLSLRLKGSGDLKIELKSPANEVLWATYVRLRSADYQTWQHRFTATELTRLHRVKLLSWVVEPGSSASIDSLALLARYPPLTTAQRVSAISYAKLARCYSAGDGLVKDRANFPAGDFDSVPASGLFCLATAAAAAQGGAERQFAVETLSKVQATVATLPRAYGLLPHFVRRHGATRTICPRTEFSTVDTALYYHAMLIAARMLDCAEVAARLAAEVRAIDFSKLLAESGDVVHGVSEDGHSLLKDHWGNWGGETALVLLLAAMSEHRPAQLKMSNSGRVHQGIGFIQEIQNLFYAPFDTTAPDAITKQNWHQRRRELLARQMAYFAGPPATAASRLGLYGLSAGEGRRGAGYAASGVDQPGARLIHPHYLLMSATARDQPSEVYAVLAATERQGLLPPWGLVENVDPELTEYLPLIGSLNAAFEALSAYHLWALTTGQPDLVYQAARDSSLLAKAIGTFYPTPAGG